MGKSEEDGGGAERERGGDNLDHSVFRIWCPRFMKGRAASRGHAKKVQSEGEPKLSP